MVESDWWTGLDWWGGDTRLRLQDICKYDPNTWLLNCADPDSNMRKGLTWSKNRLHSLVKEMNLR